MPQNHNIYHAIRMEFETPVRFGTGHSASGLDSALMSMSSDHFFAALCTEWVALYGTASLSELISKVDDQELAFAGLFPWKQIVRLQSDGRNCFEPVRYFLPRPLARGQKAAQGDTQVKKKMRKIPWIEAEAMKSYMQFVKTGEDNPSRYQETFGSEIIWDRVNTRSERDNLLYRVAAYDFHRDRPWTADETKRARAGEVPKKIISGLYWLYTCRDPRFEQMIHDAIYSLGISGIGGKTSSGLGKFLIWDEDLNASPSGKALTGYLEDTDAPVQMALGTVVPYGDRDFEILSNPESSYLLVSRTGFTSSANFCDPESGNALKRKTCIMLREGSCFPEKLSGGVLNLSYGGLHPVYRAGKTLFMGLRI